jgi:hypothetical protein
MKTKHNKECPTPEQMRTFKEYRNAIIGERLAILNHSKLNFSEIADKLKESQESYNNSLMFSYNDFSRQHGNLKSLTHINETIMQNMLENMYSSAIDVDVEYLKNHLTNLTQAIIFLYAHTFDIDISNDERIELKQHMQTLSEYRVNLMSAFDKETTLEKNGKQIPSIMHSSLDDLLVILYEFLNQIDNWEQTAGNLILTELSDELSEFYNYLEKNIVEIRRNNTEVPNSKRNELRIFCNHVSETVSEKLGGVNE